MANPSTAHEPSMEEILASIRQIISEDGEASPGAQAETKAAPASGKAERPSASDSKAASAATAAPAAAASKPETSGPGGSMKPQPSESPSRASQPVQPPAAAPPPAASAQAAPAAAATQAPERPRISDPQSPAAPPVRSSMPAPRPSQPADERNLLSDHSNQAVSGAFSALAHTILAQNARTLEDLVAEMLRPMLKEWLDGNLPPLVERLVKEEIERVSRGRR